MSIFLQIPQRAVFLLDILSKNKDGIDFDRLAVICNMSSRDFEEIVIFLQRFGYIKCDWREGTVSLKGTKSDNKPFHFKPLEFPESG